MSNKKNLVIVSILVCIVSITYIPHVDAIETIPLHYWFKNDAKWWSEAKISDQMFQISLYLLVEDKDLHPLVEKGKIPVWFANVAKWFSENRISDFEYINSIKFLYDRNIIQISNNVKSIAETQYAFKFFKPGNDLFRFGVYQKDLIPSIEGDPDWLDTQVSINPTTFEQLLPLYNTKNAVVIVPTFTFTAYTEPGFYTFFRGDCEQEFHGVTVRDDACLTPPINFEKPNRGPASTHGINILNLLGYKMISDIDVDKNPDILKQYDKVIVLHNEYVTRAEFNAITSHPNVVYLYPNALYAEIEADYDNNTITLIRGHNYPDPQIRNGFDWEFDNSPLEYNIECTDWHFEEIPNGHMLNCYPFKLITHDENFLRMINEF